MDDRGRRRLSGQCLPTGINRRAPSDEHEALDEEDVEDWPDYFGGQLHPLPRPAS